MRISSSVIATSTPSFTHEGFDIFSDVGREFSDNEVGLETDAVYGDAFFFQTLDEILVCGGFWSGSLDVEVIGVELSVGVCCTSGSECSSDEVHSSRLRKDALTNGTIIVEDF